MYDVEDYPLNWIDGTYYSTYKGNTFQVSSIENVKSEADYAAVTSINLSNQSLTTDFTNTLLSKFTNIQTFNCVDNNINILDVTSLVNLTQLRCFRNNINILDVTSLVNLTELSCYTNNISVLDVTSLINLTILNCVTNNISVLDVTSLVNLTYLNCAVNNISTLGISNLVNLTFLNCAVNQLNAATNSQILIDLDTNNKSNGFLNSTIFGGGSLTTAGQTAKSNLLSKGWTIVGI